MDPLYIIIAAVVALTAYFFLTGNRPVQESSPQVRRHAKPGADQENQDDEATEDRSDSTSRAPRRTAPEPVQPRPAAPRRVKPRSAASPPAVAKPAGSPNDPPARGAGFGGSDESASFKYLDQTVLFYEPSHGNQIEYYGRDGRAYLWYPGNRVVVVSEWRVEGGEYWSRSGTDTYNPVTKERGGDWEHVPLPRVFSTIIDAAPGDIFGLATGRLPYRLPAQPGFASVHDARSGASAPPPDMPARPKGKAVHSDAPCPCGSGKPFARCHGTEGR